MGPAEQSGFMKNVGGSFEVISKPSPPKTDNDS